MQSSDFATGEVCKVLCNVSWWPCGCRLQSRDVSSVIGFRLKSPHLFLSANANVVIAAVILSQDALLPSYSSGRHWYPTDSLQLTGHVRNLQVLVPPSAFIAQRGSHEAYWDVVNWINQILKNTSPWLVAKLANLVNALGLQEMYCVSHYNFDWSCRYYAWTELVVAGIRRCLMLTLRTWSPVPGSTLNAEL